MRIGFIGIRYPKGIGILLEDFIRMVESLGHIAHVLSYPISKRRPCLLEEEWRRNNVTVVNTFKRNTVKIDDETLAGWIKGNELDLVFTVEEPNNLRTFEICRRLGVKSINYVDVERFDPDKRETYKDCDLFFCPTQHCYDTIFEYGYQNLMLVKYCANLNHFPWKHRAVKSGQPVEFVMHAGWGGVAGRKGVEPTIRAFTKADHTNTRLTIVTQKRWKTYTEPVRKLVAENDKIRIKEVNDTKAIFNSAAYADGHMAVQPSLWEGLGLTYIEALVSGMPVITTNAQPMSEFVDHEKTGILVDAEMVPGEQITKGLRIAAAVVDEEALAVAFCLLGDNPSYIEAMSSETEKFRNRHAQYRETFIAMLNRVADE